MAWPTLKSTRNQVNLAGEMLAKRASINNNIIDLQFIKAFHVVINWRSCHSYPINTFQATLRKKLGAIDRDAIVAQRLKRISSIIHKLRRFDNMQLSRMQDIGGLRAVVATLGKARLLEDNYRKSRFSHELVRSQDYIESPKDSGYRSIHLIYRYNNNHVPAYNGLFLELQIRTRLQHAWATAVETMGTFLNQALKSSEGQEEWLRFFALSGSAFACLERTPPVPQYRDMSRKDTYAAVMEEARRLDVKNRLHVFSVAAERVNTDRRTGSYHLITLNTVEKSVSIKSYGQSNLEAASNEYGEAEQRIARGEPIQSVLVSAGPIKYLRQAYPNFFLDTHEFLKQLNRIEKQI